MSGAGSTVSFAREGSLGIVTLKNPPLNLSAVALLAYPRRRQRGPRFSVAAAACQAEAVRAVGKDVGGVGDPVGGERPRQAVGVLGWDVCVLCGVPQEERRRGLADQRIQGGRATELGCRVLAHRNHARRTIGLRLHRRDQVAE
jgi:hypothetical protein